MRYSLIVAQSDTVGSMFLQYTGSAKARGPVLKICCTQVGLHVYINSDHLVVQL